MLCAFGGYLALWLMIGAHANRALAGSPASPADVALILGARAYLHDAPNPCLVGRVEAGIDLARRGLAGALIMSGGLDREDRRIEADVMRQIALQHGYTGRILTETRSSSTHENFLFSLPVIEELHAARVIVVSEPYHLWRAQSLVRSTPGWGKLDVRFQAAPSQCWNTWGMFYKGALREPLAIANNFAKGYFRRD